MTPAKVEAFWEGEPAGKALSLAQVHELGKLLQRGQPRPDPNLIYEFAPLGNLGLFVNRGRGSFRNVVVQPLP